ncbi:MAG: glycosyltransferase family 2 protein [Geobacteraceae bacterium]|nr:glycosyltransferase family 2 protein [Geobacteraceae bacterium]
MIKISVVTPSLNKEKYIERCITSVREQGDKIFEHVIIDGLSSDRTHDIVKANDYNRIKWFSEKDKSQSDALNKGFERAEGDIILWLNADDYLAPNVIDALWVNLNNCNWDVLYGDLEIVDENGTRTAYQRSLPYRKNYLLRMGGYIPSPGCFFRKATTFNAGLRFKTELRYVMDWEYFLQCSQRELRFKNVSKLISAFRMYEGNITSESHHRARERRKVQSMYGLYTPENWIGILNMWLQYYLVRIFYKIEMNFFHQ